MTNKEYAELSEAEKISYFRTLTADDIAGLTQVQKAEYEAYLETPEDSEFSFEAYGKKYAKANKTPYNTLLVVSDGSVFYPTLKGKNSLANHVADNKSKGLTFKEVNVTE